MHPLSNCALCTGGKQSAGKPAAAQQANGVPPAKGDKGGGKGKKADARPVDLSLLDLRVGVIRKAERHPDADTLYVEEVDCGEAEPRTVSVFSDTLSEILIFWGCLTDVHGSPCACEHHMRPCPSASFPEACV